MVIIMNDHIAVQNKTQYIQVGPLLLFQTKNQESDQVIIVAPPPSPQMHDHDRVIIYRTSPPPLVSVHKAWLSRRLFQFFVLYQHLLIHFHTFSLLFRDEQVKVSKSLG